MNRGPGNGRLYTLNAIYPNVKFEVSTVNQKPLKTLTLETRFWYEKTNEIDTKVVLDKLFRNCKRTLFNHSNDFYDIDKIIHIKDIPMDLTQKSSKVFCMFEFTLFLKTEDRSELNIVLESTRITNKLFEEVFEFHQGLSRSKR
jgi:hypothetical protein